MTPWLSVIGIGDDGLSGISPSARALVAAAELLVGGARHLGMVAPSTAQRLTWQDGVRSVLEDIAAWRGRPVVVLTTGDPMWYGAGVHLARRFDASEITILPHPGAFNLAAARMGWSLADAETLTVHGRPLATLNRHIQPGARLLVLSWNGETPAEAAALLCQRGFGPSAITVLEHLGGPKERRIDGIADTWSAPRAADLNTLAIECRAGPAARILPPAPGLADDAFETDGQLTKCQVRAVTIAALAPLPGQTLWDIGAGSGSIGIEWLRTAPRQHIAGRGQSRAFAVERNGERCARIARNAAALGVPELTVVNGAAPPALADLPPPDTVFVGGGVYQAEILELCWRALPVGGRMVANAVTLEAQATLLAFRAEHGGALTQIAISRAEPAGALTLFRAMMEVTQYVGVKA